MHSKAGIYLYGGLGWRRRGLYVIKQLKMIFVFHTCSHFFSFQSFISSRRLSRIAPYSLPTNFNERWMDTILVFNMGRLFSPGSFFSSQRERGEKPFHLFSEITAEKLSSLGWRMEAKGYVLSAGNKAIHIL